MIDNDQSVFNLPKVKLEISEIRLLRCKPALWNITHSRQNVKETFSGDIVLIQSFKKYTPTLQQHPFKTP